MQVERYLHHGTEVSVLSHVKGKHRENCLCYADCVHFRPGQPGHCPIAAENYALCRKHGLVTPVFECPKFEQKEKAPDDVRRACEQPVDKRSDEGPFSCPL